MTKEQGNKKTPTETGTETEDDNLAKTISHLRFGADVIRINRAAIKAGTPPVIVRGTTSGETVVKKKSDS